MVPAGRSRLEGLRRIDEEARAGKLFKVTPEWIKEQNRIILKDLDIEEHIVPGEYTQVRLFAGSYRAAPPQDVEYLVDRLCAWLSERAQIQQRRVA